MNTDSCSKIDWIMLNEFIHSDQLFETLESRRLVKLRGRTGAIVPLILFISREVSYNLAWDLGRWVQWGTDCLELLDALIMPEPSEQHSSASQGPRSDVQDEHRWHIYHLLRSKLYPKPLKATTERQQQPSLQLWNLLGQTSQLEKEKAL